MEDYDSEKQPFGQIWQAYYQDKQHDMDCVIENCYNDNKGEQPLKLCIGNNIFWGMGFDDWELSKEIDETSLRSIMNQFSFMKYGNREKGYSYQLQSYRLQIKIPTLVFSLIEQREILAELDIIYVNKSSKEETRVIFELDGKRIEPNITYCEKFALIVEGQRFEAVNPSVCFEISLQSICKQIAGKYYLCNCFGCLYSDYSPYGQGNIGNLCCFVENKENYLKVYSKYEGEYTIWDAFGDGYVQCQETAVCKHFSPRINCLGGYRGTIYK